MIFCIQVFPNMNIYVMVSKTIWSTKDFKMILTDTGYTDSRNLGFRHGKSACPNMYGQFQANGHFRMATCEESRVQGNRTRRYRSVEPAGREIQLFQ